MVVIIVFTSCTNLHLTAGPLLFLDLSLGYVGVFSLGKKAEIYTYYMCTLLHVYECYASIKKDFKIYCRWRVLNIIS